MTNISHSSMSFFRKAGLVAALSLTPVALATGGASASPNPSEFSVYGARFSADDYSVSRHGGATCAGRYGAALLAGIANEEEGAFVGDRCRY